MTIVAGRDTTWMLPGASEDIVAIHRYPFPTSRTSGSATIEDLRANSREWETIIPNLRAVIWETTGRDLPVAVTEVNSHWTHAIGGEATPDSRHDAMWWGDVLGRLIRQRADAVICFKIGQMSQVEKHSIVEEDIAGLFIGSMLSGGGGGPHKNEPEKRAEKVDGFQAYALQTRLGIPLLYGVDATHGHAAVQGAVVFPQNIGLGATRDPDLVERVGQITAREMAAMADVGLVVVGEKPYAEGIGDRADLALMAAEAALIERVRERSQKLVVILLSGRPMIINDQLALADAWIAAWQPGAEAQGIADVLFGDYPFTGKLPYTWSRSMEQIPADLGSPGTGADALLFPFGYGLEN